ncbi:MULTISPECIES: hypothetical protein [unclassified Streptomyces]|uniref:hypothetical protein n=1 Tax=Streptomyces sp. NPDC127532 TaxID=3345399 RepID=UPI0036426263
MSLQQPPKRSNTGKIVAVGLLVLLGATGCGSDGGSGSEESKPTGAEADVKIARCVVNERTGWPTADFLITNGTTKNGLYTVTVAFVDPLGDRLTEAVSESIKVSSGQEVAGEAKSLDRVEGNIECRVTKVIRQVP